jgi:hypothetical protein
MCPLASMTQSLYYADNITMYVPLPVSLSQGRVAFKFGVGKIKYIYVCVFVSFAV